MAKHRRKKQTTHRKKSYRSRRVSGVKDIDFTVVALTIGGAVAGRIVANKLAASTNTTMQKLAPYSAVAIGILIPMISKSAMLKALGVGMVAGGGVTLLGPTGLKVISGIEATVGYPYNVLPYQRKIAGMVDNQYVSKPNFSGSGKNQVNVISGINANPAGSGAYNAMGN